MKSDDWRCDFMFAIEVFEKLNNLNLELHGKGLFCTQYAYKSESI